MYVINSHEVLISVIHGDECTPSSIGIEVVTSLNESERTFIKDWMGRNNLVSTVYLIDTLSHGDDASRYGETVSVGETARVHRKIHTLAHGIRMAIESQGRPVSVDEEVRYPKNDDILGS